jgi:hypothetical protein
MVINNQPLTAAMRPLAGFGAGAFPSAGSIAFGTPEGSCAGSYTREDVTACALPRLQWAFGAGAGSALGNGGAMAASYSQFEQHQILRDPVAPGGMGPNPVREPEPV